MLISVIIHFEQNIVIKNVRYKILFITLGNV